MKTEQVSGGTPLIELRDIYKIYHMGDTDVHASDGVSMKIYKGEFVAIVGQSGSGKSTLMNIIGCLDVPTSGQYFLNGEDVSELTDDEQAEIRNKMKCTPFVRHCGIMSNKWGVLLCQKEYQTNDTHQSLKRWL